MPVISSTALYILWVSNSRSEFKRKYPCLLHDVTGFVCSIGSEREVQTASWYQKTLSKAPTHNKLDCDSERRLKKLLFAIFAILRMVYLICFRSGEIIQSHAVINLDHCTILFSFHGLISSFHATPAVDNLKSRKSYFTTVTTILAQNYEFNL